MASSKYNLDITATNKTSKAFGSVTRGLKSVGKAAGNVGIAAVKVGGAFATVATGAMVALTKSSMSSVDALAKTADKIGVTTEALAGLHHAAAITGVATKTMDKAMVTMTNAVSEASQGVGIAKDAISELGLNAATLNKLPVDEKMKVLADAMGNVKNQSDRVRIAMDLFGAKGVDVLNTLAVGSEGLAEFAREADHLGIAVGRVDASKIEQANDSIERAQGVFKGLGNQLAVAFSPAISGVADAFRQAALDSEGFGNIGTRVLNAVVMSLGFMGDAALAGQIAWFELKIAFFQIVEGLKAKWQSFLDLLPDVSGIVDPIKNSFSSMADGIVGALQEVPVVGRLFSDSLESMADSNTAFSDGVGVVTAETAAMRAELLALYDQLEDTPPSDGITQWFETVRREAEKTGQVVAANAPGNLVGSGSDEGKKKVAEQMTFMQEIERDSLKKRNAFALASDTERAASSISTMKQLFGENKAFAVADAIMNTYKAAALALSSYPPPINAVFAGATVAAGMAQVAQIKSQSFEGGGFTGRGARSGGMDGKGGFMAMLHPNESVIDHTKGQGAGVTIINNVDATGADASVDMKIRQAMKQTSEQTVLTIQDLMRRRRLA